MIHPRLQTVAALICSTLTLLAGIVNAQDDGQGRLPGFDAFWSAENEEEREKAATRIARAKLGYEALYRELLLGPPVVAQAPTGRLEFSRKGTSGRHRYVILVPSDYDAARSYSVRFYLHGGVNRSKGWKEGGEWWRRMDRFDGLQHIAVFPASWRKSLWWQASQVENLRAILDHVKRDYNVDENRVYLFGVSDGGTGAYYHAAKAPTPWAAYFPFIGHAAVLANPTTGVEGEIFSSNFSGKTLFVVNGETDRLYPVRRVYPYVLHFRKAGAEIVFKPESSGHDTSWWDDESDAIEDFLQAHPRTPLPDALSWETESSERFNRSHWLVIEELGAAAGEADFESFDIVREPAPDGTVDVIELFPHAGPSGRVTLQREGITVTATTSGVLRFKLLISPSQFDLSAPIEVVVNGDVAFDGVVEKDPEVLLRWATRDFDRSMLFAAELDIGLPQDN